MNYKVIIQAHVGCDENEIIGVKEQITAALEHFGCTVDFINVMPSDVPGAEEPEWKKRMLNTFLGGAGQ